MKLARHRKPKSERWFWWERFLYPKPPDKEGRPQVVVWVLNQKADGRIWSRTCLAHADDIPSITAVRLRSVKASLRYDIELQRIRDEGLELSENPERRRRLWLAARARRPRHPLQYHPSEARY